jgi:single-strand DNA-binding protein
MYQSVTVAGNLGQDPELRYLGDGTPVCNFSVATNRRWKVGDEQKEEVTWFRVAVFGGMAEPCNQYLSKGRQVLVEGRLRPDDTGGPRTFTRQDGTVAASFEITANTVRFLQGSSEQAGSPASGAGQQANDEEDEIPF